MPVTDTDLELAQAAAEEAADKLDQLEHDAARSAGPPAEHLLAELSLRAVRSRQAAARLASLTAERTCQDVARTARSATVAKQRATLKELSTALESSRTGLRGAVSRWSADAALIRRAAEHNALIAGAHARLTEVVGPLVDEHGIHFDTGAASNGAVRIAGCWFAPVEPGAVFGWVAWVVGRSVLGERHPRVSCMANADVFQQLTRRTDNLFAGVEPPAPFQPAPKPRPTMVPPMSFVAGEGKPFLLRDADRRMARGGG